MKLLVIVLAILASGICQSHGISHLFFEKFPNFPCKKVNATYIDCRNLGLTSVPSGIPKATQILLLSHNQFTVLRDDSFAGLVDLRTLDVSYNSISKLEGNFFTDQSRLEHLNLGHNEIHEIPADAFKSLVKLQALYLSSQNQGLKSGFPEFLTFINKTLSTLVLNSLKLKAANFGGNLFLKSLKVLSLAANEITVLEKSDFAALAGSRLHTLDLSDNTISSIDPSVFTPIIGVKYLVMSHSFDARPPPPSLLANVSAGISSVDIQKLSLHSLGLTSLTSAMFRGLGNSTLKELDLSINEVSKLDNASFGLELKNLDTLLLCHNSLTDISYGALSGLTSLTVLDLRRNFLSEIKPGTFEHNTHLQKLYLRNNSIASLSPQGPFSGLTTLKVLDLSSNMFFQTFVGSEFKDLKQLESLDLSNSKPKSGHISLTVTANSFKILSKLKYLNLKKVVLQNIKAVPSPFAPLLELSFLDISNNNMYSLHVDTFVTLKSLETLYLDHNNLNNLWNPLGPRKKPCMFLKQLVSLKRLDFSFNGLQNIPVGALSSLTHLKTLHLSDNKLSSISGKVFDSLKELEYLDLHKNHINVVNETLLAPVAKTLKILFIGSNPFSCGCEQEWFRNWIDKTRVQIGNQSTLICASPPEWRNKPLMEFHPDVLNCDGKLLLKDWVGIGVGSLSFIVLVVCLTIFRWKIHYVYLLVRANYHRTKRQGDYEQLYDFDAFISCSSADDEWITGMLMHELESGENPFKLCHHERDFEPGTDIVDNIIKSVDRSRKTICVISQSYLESNWCSYERRLTVSKLFVHYKDVLILIILGDIPDKKLSKYDVIHRVVKKKTYLKWPAASEDEQAVFWQRLKDVLNEDRTPENYEVVA